MTIKANIMNGTDSRTEGAVGAPARRWPIIVARVLTIGLGLAAVAWAALIAPLALRQATMVPLGIKIIAGERFKAGVLEQYLAGAYAGAADGLCQPLALRTLAVARLRLAEEAISDGNADLITRTQSEGEAALRRSLFCMPTDAFLWFALFWIENSMRGLQEKNFELLRLSYRTGPNEGWLAIRRNRLAVALYPGLPADLKQAAADEFAQLVRSDLITEAAEIFAGPGTQVRSILLQRLQGIDEKKLRFLSILLAGKGIDDVFPEFDTSSRFRRR